MAKINLRKYYPDCYSTGCIIEVPDEIAVLIMDSYEHAEAAPYFLGISKAAIVKAGREKTSHHQELTGRICGASGRKKRPIPIIARPAMK